MPESRMRRAAQALRDPWSLLAAVVGAGAAWALALPVGGIGAVGAGMLAVAAVVGAVSSGHHEPDGSRGPSLVPHTVQFRLVGTLDAYLADLTALDRRSLPPVLAGQALDALEAARSARTVAVGVAGSIDVLDVAIAEAGQVARKMTTAHKVSGSLGRMAARRQDLLGDLSSAVDGVGELYAKLLELAATPELISGSVPEHGPDPVAEVNSSLDAIRGAFAELDSAARTVTAGLHLPGAR